MKKIDYQITSFSHRLASDFLFDGAFCMDATMGNGNDTLFLSQSVGEKGKVIAFDIQQKAIDKTRKLLYDHGLDNAELILQSHERISEYALPSTVDFIIFNLGYLPGSDHSITTKASSTITALEQSLMLLKKGAAICVLIYSGAVTGFEEKEAVLKWMKKLDSRNYLVIVNEYYNRPNNPPIPALIIKL